MFIVQKTTNNGYRCSCCRYIYTSTELIDDKDEALSMVPLMHKGSGDDELESITITDGATGEVIAQGSLQWTGSKSERYMHQVWSGHVADESFEELKGARPGETWADVSKRLSRETLLKEQAKLKAEAEGVAKRLKELDDELND